MRTSRLVLPFVPCGALLLLACGSDDQTRLGTSVSGGGTGGSTGLGNNGGTSTAGTDGGRGGALQAGAGGDAAGSGGGAGGGGAGQGGIGGTAGAAGSSGAGGETQLAPIDPIEVGRTWTYDVKMLGLYPTCPSGTSTSKASSSKQLAGKEAITVSSLCALAGDFDYSVDGDRVYSYFDGAWRLSLDAPVEAGHGWTDGFSQFVWERAPDTQVGGATLTDCWSAKKTVAYETFTTFCRGVGPVHWHFEDGFGNGYDAVLLSYGKLALLPPSSGRLRAHVSPFVVVAPLLVASFAAAQPARSTASAAPSSAPAGSVVAAPAARPSAVPSASGSVALAAVPLKPVAPPGAPSKTHRGAPLAITISGGVSLGAYEAGVVYYVVEFLRRNPGLFDARVFTGASAGSMNALLGAMALCAKESASPSRSLLYRTWVSVGFKQLFRPSDTTADGLFSRRAFDPIVIEAARSFAADIAPDCDVLLGVTTTRKKELAATANDPLGLARVEERFAVHLRGRPDGKPPMVKSYVDPTFRTRQALLPEDASGDVSFLSLRDVLQASSAFPLAFAPKPVSFCLHEPNAQGELACKGSEAKSVAFIDGGVFDNQPVRLAARLLSAGLEAPGQMLRDAPSFDDVTLPEQAELIHISPDNFSFPAEEGDAPRNVDRPSALGTISEFARTFIGNARSKELLGLFEERPDLRERLSVARVNLPTASSPLGAFFGFFESDFRVFDFNLGMADGRKLVEQRLLPKVQKSGKVPIFPEPSSSQDTIPEDWRAYTCLRHVLAGEPGKACDGEGLQNFRVLLQVSLDRLVSTCGRPEAPPTTDNLICTRGALGGPPPIVPHVEDKSRSGRAFRRSARESDIAYVLRRLTAYGFHFKDLGLAPNESSLALDRVRELLGDALVRFSEVQPPDGRAAIRFLALPALNLLAYAPPPNIVYGVLGSPNEVGYSIRAQRPTWLPRALRANVALQFRGLGTLLSSEDNAVALSPVVGGEVELPFSGPSLQARIGLRGGYIVSTAGGKPFGKCRSADDDVGQCSRLTTQAAIELTAYDRLRFHLLGEYLPPLFQGQKHLYSVTPAVGAQLSW